MCNNHGSEYRFQKSKPVRCLCTALCCVVPSVCSRVLRRRMLLPGGKAVVSQVPSASQSCLPPFPFPRSCPLTGLTASAKSKLWMTTLLGNRRWGSCLYTTSLNWLVQHLFPPSIVQSQKYTALPICECLVLKNERSSPSICSCINCW